jgi:divinyl protochlorophyllide a 8-vinyl-reductase
VQATDSVARIGPNAILQTMETLRAHEGERAMADWLGAAGLSRYADAPPETMVPEAEAVSAHHALATLYPGATGAALAFEAGRRTADYLLAHRIPKPAQFILKRLPARMALKILLRAISRHAWTFCGSGAFVYDLRGTPRVEIHANPLAMAPCTWHEAVFERLFQVLVSSHATVREIACVADGAEACVFEISIR